MRGRHREGILVGASVLVFGVVAIYSASCGSGVVLFTDGGASSSGSTGVGTATSEPDPPQSGFPGPPLPPTTNPNTPDASEVTPVVPCGDAGSTDPCVAPPNPRCINPEFLASFGSGTCVDGTCKYPETTYDCLNGGSSCNDNGDAGSCGPVIVK